MVVFLILLLFFRAIVVKQSAHNIMFRTYVILYYSINYISLPYRITVIVYRDYIVRIPWVSNFYALLHLDQQLNFILLAPPPTTAQTKTILEKKSGARRTQIMLWTPCHLSLSSSALGSGGKPVPKTWSQLLRGVWRRPNPQGSAGP